MRRAPSPAPTHIPFATVEGGLTSLAYEPALGNVLHTLEGFIMVFAAPWSDTVKNSSAQEYFGDVVRKVAKAQMLFSLRLHERLGSTDC